jgi:transposase InsO family protein
VKFKDRGSVKEICKWAEVPRSSFHYKAHPGQRGMKASTHTPISEGIVTNTLVVDQIRAILGMDYCVYGYHKMTAELRDMKYLINHKKVYRLMCENHLLCGRKIKTQGKRKFVKHRRIEARRPMEYLCLDIKYVWVQGENRWYYQLAIMDVFSRRILCWIFQRSVRQNDVIALMRWLDLRYGLKGVIIRNDNGSQFIAHRVREALQALEARQEFTHVATPEENAYIESFHSIQQAELMDRFSFSSYYEARKHIEKYMRWYNYKRKHGSIGMITPMQKWEQGFSWLTVKQQFEPASVDLSRPDRESLWDESAPYSLDKFSETGYLCLTGDQEMGEKNGDLVANLFEKSVQLLGG